MTDPLLRRPARSRVRPCPDGTAEGRGQPVWTRTDPPEVRSVTVPSAPVPTVPSMWPREALRPGTAVEAEFPVASMTTFDPLASLADTDPPTVERQQSPRSRPL